ncbi:MAG: RHS repeat-associated core domain-containing protein [Ginsengibacter sp.]
MQILSKWNFRFFVALLLPVVLNFCAYATNDPESTHPMLGSLGSVKVDSFRVSSDDEYFARKKLVISPAIVPNTTHIRNLVSVGIEEDSKIYIQSNFTATLVLHITKYDENDAVSEEFDSTFTVNYAKAEGASYNASAKLEFEQAYRVQVKIVSIDPHGTTAWDVSKVLRVDNILQASRDYAFDCKKAISNLHTALDAATGELTASWGDPNNGQTEYDLEWAWIDESAIDSYQPFTQDKIFTNNATRVTIDSNTYHIPLLYDGTGKLFVRVRSAQIKMDGQRVEGDWTWDLNGNNQPVAYSFDGHQNNLNWQASTSYAEEGKRKSVVQYFDGTLRNRQTVTKDNTTGTTIVAESFYDYQGRPVIQVLPAPTINTIIQYAKNFNQFAQFANYTGYPKEAYDKLADGATICANPAKPLSTTTGTANYYSPANPLIADNTSGYNENKYIPSSEGSVSGEAYPFTETRFTADGRIASQSGVGPTFQIGSGHETKYYYESVDQNELDALFGTDAGVASHYFKNIVRDANGQYSVSYSDMHGRTVATALAGDAPKNADSTNVLDPLESSNIKTVTKQLIDNETNHILGKSIISSKSLVVEKKGDYKFNYELNPEQLKLAACDINNKICYDCIYNLKITIDADCNGTEGFPYTVVDSNFTVGGLLTDPTCNVNGKTSGFFSRSFTKNLPEGAYTITKTLSLSDSAQNFYRDVFLKNDTCKKLEDFYNESSQVLLSQSNCNITCDACESAIGKNFDAFKANFVVQTGMQEPFSDSLINALNAAYKEARANCDRICNVYNSDGLEAIRGIMGAMLHDVSPNGGQYANLANVDEYSTFNQYPSWEQVFPSLGMGAGFENPLSYEWNNGGDPYPHFKNELGINDDPVYDPESKLSPEEIFSNQFKTSWAQQLLPHHPEYCKLKITMEQLPAAYAFEAKLNSLTTWSSMINATTTKGAYVSDILNNDPFFTGAGSAFRRDMETKLTNFTPLQSNKTDICAAFNMGFASLWQLAQSSVFCRNKRTEDCQNSEQTQCLITTPGMPSVNPATGCAQDWDLVWQFYRTTYLTERNKLITQYLNSQCSGVTNKKLMDAGHTPRFVDYNNISGIGSSNDAGIHGFFDQVATGDKGSVATGHNLLNAQYDTVCRGYATSWITQLSQCGLLDARWQIQATKTADSTWIVDRLRDVCQNGSDEDHYLGSASINPANLSKTKFGFSDFPAVIQAFFTNNGISATPSAGCNPYLITIPAPYDKQQPLTDMVVITKPTDCECTQITKIYTEFTNAAYGGTFSDYMQQRYQVTISDSALITLMSLCDGSYQCVFLPQPITLPAAFRCNNNGTPRPDNSCIGCLQYQAIRDSFQVIYNHAAPVANPQTPEDTLYNGAFETFANYKTGFHKSWRDYVAFADSCGHYTGGYGIGVGGADCDSLQSFIASFNQNVRKGKVTQGFETQEGKSIRDLTQLEVNGVLQLPDSVRRLPNTWYNNYGINTTNGGVFCTNNGYSVELKFKDLNYVHQGDIFYTQLGSRYAQSLINGVLRDSIFDLTLDFYTSIGLYTTIKGQRYVLDSNKSTSMVTNWMTFKFKFTQTAYYLYYNGNLAYQGIRDSTLSIGNKSAFGLGIYGRQGAIDWIKVYDNKDSLKYFEDFNDSYHPATIAPSFICPPYNCDSAFAVYYNQKRGMHYTFAQIDSLSMASCGSHVNACGYTLIDTAQNCTNLTNILNNYQNTFVTPAAKYVDIDMRTFSGNRTPDAGPKGVFDVNNNFLGNTIDGTPTQIKQSFAAIWNGNAANNAVGTLEVLTNGKFRLHLQPGQVMPCHGIIGMRYYQFDTPNGTVDAILTGTGTFIDFGDGSKIKVDSSFSGPATDIFSSAGGIATQNKYLTTYYVLHRFTAPSLRTVTVYHPDIRGIVGFDNWNNDAINLTTLKNLRGYLPNDTRGITFHSTQDSSLNTFNQIANKGSIIHLQNIGFASGDNNVTSFLNYNFGSFVNNPGIQVASIANALAGDTMLINTVLPNIPVNFKKLKVLQSFGYNYTDDVKLLMPEATLVNIQYGLQSYQVDTILNQLARSVISDSGSIYLHWGNGPRTGASDDAVNILHSKGWYVYTAADATFTPIPIIKVIDSTPGEPVLYSEFTDYVNARLHTNYTLNQIISLYERQCGHTPDICTPPPVTTDSTGGPRLCGGNIPVFEKLVYTPEPCKDLDKMAYTFAEEKWQLYTDSVRNVFDTAYYNKCMNAKNLESFTVTYQTSEYHYTLYYYDQAGNLVKTVPPAGVDDKHGDDIFLAQVKTARADALINGASAANVDTPNHKLVTRYRYNTLNQVIAQQTPDAGISNFWYDALGRLVVSQNAKQAAPPSPLGEGPGVRFSYTIYDQLGRISEVGQKPKANGNMNQNITRDPVRLSNWLNNKLDKEQITRTVYDVSYYAGENPATLEPTLYQRHLRNRVSYTQVFDTEPANDNWLGTHTAATYYTYDIHGNVDTLLQDYNTGIMKSTGNRFKKIVYDYDLISGKVNMVSYQPGKPDAFYHKYSYDAENRLVDVETSRDKMVWDKDARYFYYKHGPLSRTILGQNQVQGLDYAYTLQGWLKGVNSTSVGDGSFDIGQDGKIGSGNSNIGRDAFGFSLNYFTGEYKPIGGSSPFANVTVANNLFNGNINAMAVNIPKLGDAKIYGYKYDQLNRLVAMDAYNGLNNTTNVFTPVSINDYKERISYDANGNIKSYLRNGNAARLSMDNLTYTYKPNTNQLDKVTDAAPDAAFGEYDKYNDIKQGQQNKNYQYDEIGNLISDVSEGISKIDWTVYGKISSITKNGGVNISYTYDASGNRISKTVSGKETFYVRDASGNVMSIYNKDASINNGDLTQTEIHLYGSSRLGVYNLKNNLEHPDLNTGRIITFTTGNKFFELSNHLGNVLATVSDKKIGIDTNADGVIDYFTADVVSAQDYYPFGMQMPSRKYSVANTNYRYGFNGKELDKETSGTTTYDYGFRIYSPGLGKFLSVDPLFKSYPWNSTYAFAENDPISFIDLDGSEKGKPSILQKAIDALTRSFRAQTTGDVLLWMTKNDLWNRTSYPAQTRMGRIYEDAVLRSYGLDKNGETFRNTPTSTGVKPDAVKNARGLAMGYISGSSLPVEYKFEASNSYFIDAKFSSSLSLEPNNNSSAQIKGMIDYLSTVKGMSVNGQEFPNEKASDYGLAKLEFVTPANALIGGNLIANEDIVTYATQKNVLLTQRYTEVDKENANRIRVGPGLPLNAVSIKKDPCALIGDGGACATPTQIPSAIYDRRPSVEMNVDVK